MLKSLRHALRLLRKAPGFTLVSISSLAIGIGATSAMFSFADALLCGPCRFPSPAASWPSLLPPARFSRTPIFPTRITAISRWQPQL